jgi:hypothetical protein
MKPTNILISLAVLCCMSSCNTNQKLKNEKTSPGVLVSTLKVDNCFDEKMERWFIAFNQYQDEGLSMDDANVKAVTTAASEFVVCPVSENRIAKNRIATGD